MTPPSPSLVLQCLCRSASQRTSWATHACSRRASCSTACEPKEHAGAQEDDPPWGPLNPKPQTLNPKSQPGRLTHSASSTEGHAPKMPPKHAMLSDEQGTCPSSRCTRRATVDPALPVMPAWLIRHEVHHAAAFWPASPGAAQPAGQTCPMPACCRPRRAPRSSPGVQLAVLPPPCPKHSSEHLKE